MKANISRPPKKFQNDLVALEQWKQAFRDKRREKEKRKRKGLQIYRAAVPWQGKATQMMWSSRKRAQRKKLDWQLSMEWIRIRLVTGRCEETEIPFDMSKGNRRQKPFAPSLERLDCKKGYTESNTKVVVWIHNQAKSDWGVGPLHQYIKLYLKHLAKNKSKP